MQHKSRLCRGKKGEICDAKCCIYFVFKKSCARPLLPFVIACKKFCMCLWCYVIYLCVLCLYCDTNVLTFVYMTIMNVMMNLTIMYWVLRIAFNNLIFLSTVCDFSTKIKTRLASDYWYCSVILYHTRVSHRYQLVLIK